MAQKGSITFSIEAEITGYQSQLKEIQAAFNKLDPGSSLAKSISKALATTTKQVDTLGRNLTQTISSQEGIERLRRNLETVGFNIREMAMALSGANWKDLAEGPAAELKKLNAEIETIKQNASAMKITAFDQLLKDVPKLKDVFEELKIDPKKMSLEGIEKKFKDESASIEKSIKDVNKLIEESQAKIDKYNRAIAAGTNLPNYARDNLANLKTRAGQNDVFARFKSEGNIFDPKNSVNYQNLFGAFQNKLLNNLGQGVRQDNEALVEKVKADLQKPLQDLQTAITEEAIKSALMDIDKILGTGTPTGMGGGKRIYGTTGQSLNDWASKLVEAGTFTPQVPLEAFQKTLDTYKRMADDLKSRGEDTSIIESYIKNMFPSMSANEIKADFNIIADEIHKGYQLLLKEYEEGKAGIEKAKSDNVKNNENLTGLQERQTELGNAQSLIAPVIAQLNEKIKEANAAEARVREAIKELNTRADAQYAGKGPYEEKGKEIVQYSNESMERANVLAASYSQKLNEIQQAQQGLNNLQSFIQRWFSVYAAINLVKKAINSVKTTISDLDKVMTEIAIVTNMTQDDLWKQMSSYTDMAKQYAVSIKGVYQVSQLYYQQGLQQNEVMQLTEQTLKMARISGLEYATATDYMTNAIRSFKLEASDAQKVVDVYSAVAASSATNTAELATAMSKTASSAESVGSSFENTTAMMAVMIEATRESATNIGSALKSIISRYGEMKADPSKLVDSEGEEMSLNKVDKALQTVGISIHNAAGQFREFDDVITELAGKWDTIDTNTQRYIATIMAGNRQQSRFLALVSNGERLAELSEEAANAEDTATLQVLKTMDSIEAKSQQLQTSLQSMFTETGIEKLYKGILDFGNEIINTFTRMPTLFKLPIPAIMSFAQIFISLGSSLVTAFKILQEKLKVEADLTNQKILVSKKIAAGEELNAEQQKVAKELEVEKKLTEDLKKEHQQRAANAQNAAEQEANARNNAVQGSTSLTSIDWSKLGAPSPELAQRYYQAMLNGNGVEKGIAKAFFAQNNRMSIAEQIGIAKDGQFINVAFTEIKEGAEEASKSTITLIDRIKGTTGAILGLRMAGSSLQMIAAGMNEATASARGLKGAIQLVGGAMQALSFVGNPIMLAFTAITTAVSVLSTWIETAEERLQRLSNTAEELTNKALQAKADQKTLQQGIEKVKELEQTRYDSAEAAEEYQNEVEKLAQSFPELIRGFDEAGNVIIDVTSGEDMLAAAREKTAQATYEAAKAELERVKEQQNQTEEKIKGLKSENSNIHIPTQKDTSASFIEEFYHDVLGGTDSLAMTSESFREDLIKKNSLSPAFKEIAEFYRQETGALVTSFEELIQDVQIEKGKEDHAEIVDQLDTLFTLAYSNTSEKFSEIPEFICEDFIKNIDNYDFKTEEGQKAYKNFMDAYNRLGEEGQKYVNELLDTNELGKLIIDLGNNISAISGYSKSVISTWINLDKVNQEGWKFLQGNNEAALILTERLSNLWNTDKFKDLDFDTFKTQDEVKDELDKFQETMQIIFSNATDSQKEQFDTLLKNKGNYTNTQFVNELSKIFNATNEQLQEIGDYYYEGVTSYQDYLNALVLRYENQEDFKLFGSQEQHTDLLKTLGSDELQHILSIYDNIAGQIKAKNISPQLGQNILNSYFDIWEATNQLDDKSREIAQGILKTTDFSSLVGVDELRNSLEQADLGEGVVNTLVELATNYANLMPENLIVDFETMSKNMVSQIDDFEKALKNASKGMGLEDATKMAEKLDLSLGDFDFKAGQYFFKDANAIKDAYYKYNKETIEELNNQFYEEQQDLLRVIQGTNSTSEQRSKASKDLIELKTVNENLQAAIKQYGEYQVNAILIQNGMLEDFLNNLNEKGANLDVQEQLKIIQKGDWKALNSAVKPYVEELQKLINDIPKTIIDGALNSIKEGSPQIIDATDMTKEQINLIKSLGGEIIEGTNKYLFNLNKQNIEATRNTIQSMVANDIITDKVGDSYLAELHNVEFEDNIYEGLSGLIDKYDEFSYEAAQSFLNAVGDIRTPEQAFGAANVEGNFAQTYEQMSTFLDWKFEELGTKKYNELKAKLEKHRVELSNTSILSTVIQNRDKLNEENVESIANLFGMTYDQAESLLNKNSDGTYSIGVAKLQTFIKTKGLQLNSSLQELLASQIDGVISSITGLAGSQSKGFTDLASMQKFASRAREAGFADASIKTLFDYDNTLHAYRLNTEGLIRQVEILKGELDKLSDEEAEVAQQLIQDTQRQFAEQIDFTSLRDAIGTNEFAKVSATFKKSVEDYNAVLMAMAKEGEVVEQLNAEALIGSILQGGQAAIQAAQKIAEIQGHKMTADEAESAYRAQVERYVNAIDTVIAKPGEIVDRTTATIIRQSGGQVQALGNSGTYLVESAANLYEAYNNLLNRMRATGEATLADLNKVAALALENRDGEQQVIDALGDAAGMTFTRFGEILADAGIELTEDMVNKLEDAGIIDLIGGNKMRIMDFSAFAKLMNWSPDSEEYVSAFKTYNDSLIELNRKAEHNILEEAKNVASAKGGDWVNITQLWENLNGKLGQEILSGEKLNKDLSNFGATIEDGILKISDNADIPSIMQAIAQAAAESGTLISSELAELADAVADAIKSYADLISGGISGSLSNVQAEQLQDWADQFDIQLNFKQTADGLKISTDQAIALYQELKNIDALQGQLVFKDLVDALSSDKGGKFENITKTMGEINKAQNRIKEIQTDIDNLTAKQRIDGEQLTKPEQAKLNILQKQKSELQEQLKLYNQIAMQQMDNPDSYNFMNRDLPETFQGPINYWNSVGQAFGAMKTAGQTGKMDIADFYNIVNEMSNLAVATGSEIQFMGQSINGDLTTAADLIEAGFNSLSNVDGKGVQIDMAKLAANLQTGATDMGKGFDDAIRKMAQSQVDMLDAMIQLLETVVAMEKLGEVDIDKNGLLSIGEIFEDDGSFTKTFDGIREYLLNSEALQPMLDDLMVNGIKLRDLFDSSQTVWREAGISEQQYADIMSAFYKAAISEDYDLDKLVSSVLEQLNGVGQVISYYDEESKKEIVIDMSGNSYTIDWNKDEDRKKIRQAFVDAGLLKGDGKKLTQEEEDEIRKILEEGHKGNLTGEYLLAYDLTYEVIKEVTVKEDDGTEKTEWVDSYGNHYDSKEAAVIGNIFAKQGSNDGAEAQGKREELTAGPNTIGYKQTFVIDSGLSYNLIVGVDGKETYTCYASDGTPISASSYQEMISKLLDKETQIETGDESATYAEQDKETQIKIKRKAKVSDELIVTGDPTTDKTRGEVADFLNKGHDAIQKEINDATENGEDYKLPLGDAEFSWPAGTSADTVIADLMSQLGLDSTLVNSIQAALTGAFSGEDNALGNAIAAAIVAGFGSLTSEQLGEQEIPELLAKITNLRITGATNITFGRSGAAGALQDVGKALGIVSDLIIPSMTASVTNLIINGVNTVSTNSINNTSATIDSLTVTKGEGFSVIGLDEIWAEVQTNKTFSQFIATVLGLVTQQGEGFTNDDGVDIWSLVITSDQFNFIAQVLSLVTKKGTDFTNDNGQTIWDLVIQNHQYDFVAQIMSLITEQGENFKNDQGQTIWDLVKTTDNYNFVAQVLSLVTEQGTNFKNDEGQSIWDLIVSTKAGLQFIAYVTSLITKEGTQFTNDNGQSIWDLIISTKSGFNFIAYVLSLVTQQGTGFTNDNGESIWSLVNTEQNKDFIIKVNSLIAQLASGVKPDYSQITIPEEIYLGQTKGVIDVEVEYRDYNDLDIGDKLNRINNDVPVGKKAAIQNEIDSDELKGYVDGLTSAVAQGESLSQIDFSNLEMLNQLGEDNLEDLGLSEEQIANIKQTIENATTIVSDSKTVIETATKATETVSSATEEVAKGVNTLSSLVVGDLPNIATALTEIAAAAERMQSIDWSTISSGLSSILGITSPEDSILNQDNGAQQLAQLGAALKDILNQITTENVTMTATNNTLESPTFTLDNGTINVADGKVNVTMSGPTDSGNDGGQGQGANGSGAGENGGQTTTTGEISSLTASNLSVDGLNSANITSISSVITSDSSTITAGEGTTINAEGGTITGTITLSGNTNGSEEPDGEQTTGTVDVSSLTSAVESVQTSVNDTASSLDKLSGAISSLPDKSQEVNNTAEAMDKLKSKSVTFTGKVVGTVDGTIKAHISADGAATADANFDESSKVEASGSADAKGTISANGSKTLVGELGPELIVSNGRYFVVGQDGPEMIDLADDSIVFNHLQTKKLLANGKVGTRGKPQVSERKSISFATGNVEGPAFASASEALAALKQLRAMWQSLARASLKDMGGLGNGSGGGGGGGGQSQDPKYLKAVTEEVERWYNWLQEIEETQQRINKLTKEYTLLEKQGISSKERIDNLKAQAEERRRNIQVRQDLIRQQKEDRQKKAEDYNKGLMGAFYNVNEETGAVRIANDDAFIKFISGLKGGAIASSLRREGKIAAGTSIKLNDAEIKENYKSYASSISKSEYDKLSKEEKKYYKKDKKGNYKKKKLSETNYAKDHGSIKFQREIKSGLDLMSELQAEDASGQKVHSAREQYQILKSFGILNKFPGLMKGVDTSQEGWETTVVENFYAAIDADKEELESLTESINEQEQAALEDATAILDINEQIEKMVEPVAGVTEGIERWYDLLKKIEVAQARINQLSKLGSMYQNDQVANGDKIYENYKAQLEALNSQIKLNQELITKRQTELSEWDSKNKGLSKFVEINEQTGMAEYKQGAINGSFTFQKGRKITTTNYEGQEYKTDIYGRFVDKEGIFRDAQGNKIESGEYGTSVEGKTKKIEYDEEGNMRFIGADGKTHIVSKTGADVTEQKKNNFKVKETKETEYDEKGQWIDQNGKLRNSNGQFVGGSMDVWGLTEGSTATFNAQNMSLTDFLSAIQAVDENGKTVYTADEQAQLLRAAGLEDYMKYDAQGNQIYKEYGELTSEQQTAAVTAGINRIKDEVEKRNNLVGEINQTEEENMDLYNSQLEIQQQMLDRVSSFQDSMKEAVVQMKQDRIDNLKEEKDAIEESSNNIIEGLSDALEKEKRLYESDQNESELNKLQNQLAILQRSGGSISQIRNLEEQIASKQKDMYFDERQAQIDAIKEASDKQIEKMEEQINLMQDTLDWQIESGQIWEEVNDKLNNMDSQEMADFLSQYSKDYSSLNPLAKEQTFREYLEGAQFFEKYKNDTANPLPGVTSAVETALNNIETTLTTIGQTLGAQTLGAAASVQTAKADEAYTAYETGITDKKYQNFLKDANSKKAVKEAYQQAYNQTYSTTSGTDEEKRAAAESAGKTAANQILEQNYKQQRTNDWEAFKKQKNIQDDTYKRIYEQAYDTGGIEAAEAAVAQALTPGGKPPATPVTQPSTSGSPTTSGEGQEEEKVIYTLKGNIYSYDTVEQALLKSKNNRKSIPAGTKIEVVAYHSEPRGDDKAIILKGKDGRFYPYLSSYGTVNMNALSPKDLSSPVGIYHVTKKGGINSYSSLKDALNKTEKGRKHIDTGKDLEIEGISKKKRSGSNVEILKMSDGRFVPYLPSWGKLLNRGKLSTFDKGGLIDFTGPAWVDGTKEKPEGIFNFDQIKLLKDYIYSSQQSTSRMIQDVIDAQEAMTALTQAVAQQKLLEQTEQNNDSSINIEHVEMSMEIQSIANDYDARRAGQQALEEMVRIARKTGNRSVTRR